MLEQPKVPYSADAERGVLSSLLIAPDAVLDVCVRRGVSDEWFFVPQHADIFRAILEANSASKAIDFITLAQILKDKGQLERVGGGPYLSELFVYLPTAANVSYYIEIVESKFYLREAIDLATSVINRASNEAEKEDVLELMEQRCLAIRSNRFCKQATSMRDLAMASIGAIQELYENRGKITGIETGFRSLDILTNGAHPAEMTIIAARPSVGKTAISMNIAEHMAMNGVKVIFFSAEMSQEQLGKRILCSLARVDSRKVQQGFLSERDFPALAAAAAKMAGMTLTIDDTAGPSIEYIRGVCRRHRRLNPTAKMAVFIDYVGLCTTTTLRAKATVQDEMAAVSMGAKAISKEIACPVYLLSQLNRESSKQQRRPRLTDLRMSGSLEQDADTVFLLHRPEMELEHDDPKIEDERGKAELIIAKQRNGPVGDPVLLTFLKEYTRFECRANT